MHCTCVILQSQMYSTILQCTVHVYYYVNMHDFIVHYLCKSTVLNTLCIIHVHVHVQYHDYFNERTFRTIILLKDLKEQYTHESLY